MPRVEVVGLLLGLPNISKLPLVSGLEAPISFLSPGSGDTMLGGPDRMSTALSGSSSAGLFPFHTAHTAGCCWSAVGMETLLVSPFFFFFFAAICAFSGCARGVLGLTFQLGRSLLSPSHHIFPMWSHHPPPSPLLFCSPFLSLFLHASFYSELAWAPQVTCPTPPPLFVFVNVGSLLSVSLPLFFSASSSSSRRDLIG